MINKPVSIVLFLLAIEILIFYVSSHPRFKKYFEFLPAVFWIYFLPMLSSTLGLLDAKSPVYSKITTYLLPAALLLLLVSVDIKSILKLGKSALLMFFAGSAGVILGAPLVFFLFKSVIGNQFWSGFGAISASWTGGSANMIAVKEALGTPDNVFLPMVIVDTIVPYVWMGILVALARRQMAFDTWNFSDRKIVDELSKKFSSISLNQKIIWKWDKIILILLLAAAGSAFSLSLAHFLPEIKNMISAYAWTVIVVSILGITLSFTSVKKLESHGSTRMGYFLLYFVLTSIGAKATLNNLGATLILVAAGFLIVLVHAIFLIVAARILKAPMFLVAVASQANIGGVASTPIVAEIYQPGMACVGLLLAILGNIVGTYFGLLAGQLCHLFL